MSHGLPKEIEVLFVAGFGPVLAKQKEGEMLFNEILRLPLESMPDYEGYWHSQRIDGVKHFALWPLDKAALACFGSSQWPAELPTPQAWLELEVSDIQSATNILEQYGWPLLTRRHQEPWGQIVTRFLSPDGLLMAITYTPFLRDSE